MSETDSQAKNPQEWLSTKQAAELFNIKPGTLAGWRRLRFFNIKTSAGKPYPRYHKWGGLVRYEKSEFEADLKAMESQDDNKMEL
jgi:hypothetical protein